MSCNHSLFRRAQELLSCAAVTLLVACGGGGDSDDPGSRKQKASAAEVQFCPACVFGPKLYVRETGTPQTDATSFSADPAADYVIDIDDRGSQGADGSVTLNGAVLLPPRTAADVGPRHIRRSVTLIAANQLVVRLTGKPGSSLSVQLLGGTKSVGPTGGTVRTPGGGLRLEIPPAALSQDTEISAYATAATTPPDHLDGIQPIGTTWALEPHGLQFDLPVAALINYSALLGQVASSDEIGIVHWDTEGTHVDVATATDDPQNSTLSFTLDSFSLLRTVKKDIGEYGLYKMRWGVPRLTTSNSSEFATWGAETAGTAFTTDGQHKHIVIERVTLPTQTICAAGHVSLYDTLSRICLPSLTRVLGATDQVKIWLITDPRLGPTGRVRAPNETVLRHAIGHALGIAHPWRMPPATSVPRPPTDVPVMAPVSTSGCEAFYCLPFQEWRLFSRSGLHAQDVAAIRAKYGPPLPPPPQLLTPPSGAQVAQNDQGTGCSLLPNSPRRGYGHKIAFDWASVPGATQYHLVASHAGATFPIVDIVVSQPNYTSVSCNSFVADQNLTNWSWKVQSLFNGDAGEFSAPRPFEFAPCRLPDGAACDTGPGPYPAIFDNGVSSGPQQNFGNDVPLQRLFEDFTLGQGAVIRTIRWQQHDHRQSTYLSTEVLIFTGLPFSGPPVFSANLIASRRPNSTGAIFGDWEGFDYEISGLSVNLPVGTYWIGLNTNHLGIRSGWDNTVGGASAPGFRVVNPNFPAPGILVNGNLAFQLF